MKTCQTTESPQCTSYYCGNDANGNPLTKCKTNVAFRYNKGEVECQKYTLPNNISYPGINYNSYKTPEEFVL